MHEEALIHGTCLALGAEGVLLLGQPGSGKSDLALRLIDAAGTGLSGRPRAARLVADDQVVVRKAQGSLMASAPAALAGKVEIRGLGIVDIPAQAEVALRLAVRLTPAADIERLPDLSRARMEILGIAIPLVLIDPENASAPARIRAALDHFNHG
jgi:serine kinase of HPr protein (carbohydrate metabolism regulator)